MKFSFNKEDLFTIGGFVLDSYTTYRTQFEEVAPDDYTAAFLANFTAARQKLRNAPGAAGRTGAGKQVTTALYANLDAADRLLNRLQIRLDLVKDATTLTVAPADFKVPLVQRRLRARDAEGALKKLATLTHLISDNLPALLAKGYKQQELDDLNDLREKIDAGNQRQNQHLNTGLQTTVLEDADYKAVDDFVKQVRKTARRLFKGDKATLKEFSRKELLRRIHAGEKPKRDEDGDGA